MKHPRRPAPVSRVSQAIRQIVHEQPGIHFRGLARAAGVTSAGQLRHHIDRLQRQGLLLELSDGRYKRFFMAGEQDARVQADMARFSRAVPRRIARLLLVRPMNRSQLRRSLGCADSTLGYHLGRMLRVGDLVRDRTATMCLYSLASTDCVRNVLIHQQPPLEDAPAPAPASPPQALERPLQARLSEPSWLNQGANQGARTDVWSSGDARGADPFPFPAGEAQREATGAAWRRPRFAWDDADGSDDLAGPGDGSESPGPSGASDAPEAPQGAPGRHAPGT